MARVAGLTSGTLDERVRARSAECLSTVREAQEAISQELVYLSASHQIDEDGDPLERHLIDRALELSAVDVALLELLAAGKRSPDLQDKLSQRLGTDVGADFVKRRSLELCGSLTEASIVRALAFRRGRRRRLLQMWEEGLKVLEHELRVDSSKPADLPKTSYPLPRRNEVLLLHKLDGPDSNAYAKDAQESVVTYPHPGLAPKLCARVAPAFPSGAPSAYSGVMFLGFTRPGLAARLVRVSRKRRRLRTGDEIAAEIDAVRQKLESLRESMGGVVVPPKDPGLFVPPATHDPRLVRKRFYNVMEAGARVEDEDRLKNVASVLAKQRAVASRKQEREDDGRRKKLARLLSRKVASFWETTEREKRKQITSHTKEQQQAILADKKGLLLDEAQKLAKQLAEDLRGRLQCERHEKVPLPELLQFKDGCSLRDYQRTGLDWLVSMHERGVSGILADEMGLGKTVQTISLLAHLACHERLWGPHLIVVPTSVLLNWDIEFKKWAPGMKVLVYSGSAKTRTALRKGWTRPSAFDVCIVSYSTVLADAVHFRRIFWEYMILDEAHNIKNWKSQKWQAMHTFRTSRRLLLTGTPLQNNMMEIWALLRFLMPESPLFASDSNFNEWFNNPMTEMLTEGARNAHIVEQLHQLLRPFILRRVKRQVEQQMPKKIEKVLRCRLSKRQRTLYDEFMQKSETKETMNSGSYIGIMGILMALRKVCNHPSLFEPRPVVSPFVCSDERRGFTPFQVWGLLGMPFDAPRLFQPSRRWLEFDNDLVGCPKEGLLRRCGLIVTEHLGPFGCLVPSHHIESELADTPPPDLRELVQALDNTGTRREGEGWAEYYTSLESLVSSAASTRASTIARRNNSVTARMYPLRTTPASPILGSKWVLRHTPLSQPPKPFVLKDLAGWGGRGCNLSDLPDNMDPPLWARLLLASTSTSAGKGQQRAPPAESGGDQAHLPWDHACELPPVVGSDGLLSRIDPKRWKCAAKGRGEKAKSNRGALVWKPRGSKPAAAKEWSSSIALPSLCPTSSLMEHPVDNAIVLRKFFIAMPRALAAPPEPPPWIGVNQPHRPIIPRLPYVLLPELRLLEYDCGKLQVLAMLLPALKAKGHRALIFTQMTHVLDILESFLSLHGFLYLRLDGSTKVEDRQYRMEVFNNDTRYLCFILSTRSGGVGINLTGADTVIFYDSDWNPAMDLQAQDRCHRIGQTRDVTVYRLISKHTVEENILVKARQKKAMVNMVIKGGGFDADFNKQKVSPLEFFHHLDDDELEALHKSEEGAEAEMEFDGMAISEALAELEDDEDKEAFKRVRAELQAANEEFDEGKARGNSPTMEALADLTPLQRYAFRISDETRCLQTKRMMDQASDQLELFRQNELRGFGANASSAKRPRKTAGR